ncbi:uncharacterized protein F5Z01DRAFT_185467 [Emericellopsis atlantica]|uniref:Uncharacterized protein n=1 Tax=Emericellopsis atlantica TaxID=2614577 RepID=A0A9P8CPI2_9HYPO|nr:uncharacterized protein F5Z01DRAFT_185467 [Emericellopsis atlantica]KAG9252781.1 hypothetical protein F5Z01DRAFT_185467 [Emericellopsis atlantica]
MVIERVLMNKNARLSSSDSSQLPDPTPSQVSTSSKPPTSLQCPTSVRVKPPTSPVPPARHRPNDSLRVPPPRPLVPHSSRGRSLVVISLPPFDKISSSQLDASLSDDCRPFSHRPQLYGNVLFNSHVPRSLRRLCTPVLSGTDAAVLADAAMIPCGAGNLSHAAYSLGSRPTMQPSLQVDSLLASPDSHDCVLFHVDDIAASFLLWWMDCRWQQEERSFASRLGHHRSFVVDPSIAILLAWKNLRWK